MSNYKGVWIIFYFNLNAQFQPSTHSCINIAYSERRLNNMVLLRKKKNNIFCYSADAASTIVI